MTRSSGAPDSPDTRHPRGCTPARVAHVPCSQLGPSRSRAGPVRTFAAPVVAVAWAARPLPTRCCEHDQRCTHARCVVTPSGATSASTSCRHGERQARRSSRVRSSRCRASRRRRAVYQGFGAPHSPAAATDWGAWAGAVASQRAWKRAAHAPCSPFPAASSASGQDRPPTTKPPIAGLLANVPTDQPGRLLAQGQGGVGVKLVIAIAWMMGGKGAVRVRATGRHAFAHCAREDFGSLRT